MKLQKMVQQKSEWLQGLGALSEVVISSRIRLARNLKDIPFPQRAKPIQLKKVIEKLKEVLPKIAYLEKAYLWNIKELDSIDKKFLVERHLISYELAQSKIESAVIIGEKELLSIMLNEEDHLRLQAMESGLSLNQVWNIITKLDDKLDENLEYAFDKNWGYLTACPTNTGTGIRASILVHLIGLAFTGEIDKIWAALNKIGMVVRGLYGEGTRSIGNFYQISNQITLGQTEENIIENLERIIKQIISYEQGARHTIFKENRIQIEDKVYRAFGILKNARLISFEETMEFLSLVRLGLYLQMKLPLDLATINELMIITQPAHLQELEGKELTPKERDYIRADFIRKKLSKV